MDIAKLVARLELQSSQFQSELEKTNRKLLGFQQQSTKALSGIERQAKAFGRALTGMFAGLSIAGAVGAIKQAIQLGDEIGKAATKAGIGAQAMSELAFAARMADVDLKALSNSIRFMQVNLSKASTGGKEQLMTLKALGLELKDLQGIKADEQFEKLAGAIASLQSAEDKARAATELFGKSGAELLPLFESGAEGIRKAREEAQKFGASFSDDVIATLQKGDEAAKKLAASWDVLWARIAVGAVNAAEAVDLIDKDAIGELKDQLALAQQELREATMLPEGGAFDPERYKRAADAVEELRTKIRLLSVSRGGGQLPGVSTAPAPGFAAAAATPAVIPDAFTPEMRRNIAAAEEWRKTIGEADEATRKFIEGTLEDFSDSGDGLPNAFKNIEEPVLQLSESLIQADELQKEFTRSMFSNFSDLFMEIGNGADNFAHAMLNAFKRILADRATLALFDMLSGLGGSLTGKSGGNGLLGAIGSGLTSLFGGTRAQGGPMQSGKWYIAGEHGPEAIWGGGGAYAMGYGGAGGATVNITTNIDARGSTPDTIKLLPEILKRNNEALKADIVRGLRSGKY